MIPLSPQEHESPLLAVVLRSLLASAVVLATLVPASNALGARVVGDRGRDVLRGTNGPDRILGFANNDRIFARGGSDLARGGAGNDRMWAGVGHDRQWGDSGSDRLVGGRGADRQWGGPGNDRIEGQRGNDRSYGQAGADVIIDGRGRDLLVGGPGNDRLAGGVERDVYYGGPGRDRIISADGIAERVFCGPGVDRVVADGMDVLRDCERVTRRGGQPPESERTTGGSREVPPSRPEVTPDVKSEVTPDVKPEVPEVPEAPEGESEDDPPPQEDLEPDVLPPATPPTAKLDPGEGLAGGERLRSPNGRYRLEMQGDGNLVVYGPLGKALWQSANKGGPGDRAVMQGDGNFVVYAGSAARFNTGTAGNPGAWIQIQDDGNLVVYAPGARVLWDRISGRRPPPAPPKTSPPARLDPGRTLGSGTRLQSPNGAYRLNMQGDGNLVLYGPAGARWASASAGNPGARTVMQGDGNLVVYSPGNKVLFASGTSRPGAWLQVQNDGNLVIYGPGNAPLWAISDLFRFPLGDGTSSAGITRGYCEATHLGTDWDAPIGTPIYAIGAGRVVATGEGYNGGWGNSVVLRHDLISGTYFSRYAHMNEPSALGVGAFVARGQRVGSVGWSGRVDPPDSTGRHLHLEISTESHVNGGYGACGAFGTLDPLAFIASR